MMADRSDKEIVLKKKKKSMHDVPDSPAVVNDA